MTKDELIQLIQSQVYDNGSGAITGQVMQRILLQMVADMYGSGGGGGGGSTDIPDDYITNAMLKDRIVTGEKIGLYEIREENMGALSVGTGTIKDLSVTRAKMGLLAVGNENVANKTLKGEKIAANTLTDDLMAANTLKNRSMADNCMATRNIQDGAITREKLAADAIPVTPNNMRGPWALNTVPVVTTRSLTLATELNTYAAADALPTYTISTNTTVSAMTAPNEDAARPLVVLKMQSSATGERIITVRDFFGDVTLTLGTGGICFLTFIKAQIGDTAEDVRYLLASTLVR